MAGRWWSVSSKTQTFANAKPPSVPQGFEEADRTYYGNQGGRVTDAPGGSRKLAKVQSGNTIEYGQFRLTQVGMQINGEITLDEWRAAGAFLYQMRSWLNFWIGDWINAAANLLGESIYREASQITGMTEETLMNIASVCGKVDFSLRNERLTWSHHVVVSPLSPERQQEYLQIAAEKELSVARLRRLIEGKRTPNKQRDELLNKKHRAVFNRLWKGVISLDPANVSRDDIAKIRKWLDAVDRALDDVTPAP
jgi:hypothetical protein